MKKLSIIMLTLLLLVVASFGASATCLTYTYVNYQDGKDYYNLSNTNTNTTGITSNNVTFLAFNNFVPRLNFSQTFTEYANFSGTTHVLANGEYQLEFFNATSITLYNGTVLTAGNTIGASNYSYNGTLSTIKLINRTIENKTITIVYTRNFNKTITNDPFGTNITTTHYNKVCTYCTGMVTLLNTPDYGTNVAFKIALASLNNSNWAVTWLQTNRTCTLESNNIDVAAYDGINSTKTLFYAGIGLFAILLLVIAGFGIIQIFNGGQTDLTTLSVTVIGGGILLIVSSIIIFMVAKALIG